MFNNGQVFIHGVLIGTGAVWTTGTVIDEAVDLVNNRVWYRAGGGNWNGSGTANPATNTGGIDISTLNPGPYFAANSLGTTVGETYTVNFGATAYSFAAPSGFGNW
jgi:hypothetical protein